MGNCSSTKSVGAVNLTVIVRLGYWIVFYELKHVLKTLLAAAIGSDLSLGIRISQ